jgi:hypothetical protein
MSKNRTYNLRFNEDEDLYFQIEGSLKNVGVDDNNKIINWPLVPTAYIKFHIKNSNCFDNNDNIFITAIDDYGEYSVNNGWGYSGCAEYLSDRPGWSRSIRRSPRPPSAKEPRSTGATRLGSTTSPTRRGVMRRGGRRLWSDRWPSASAVR